MNAKPTLLTVDGNEAVAHVAYRLNEVMAIYPITPSSPIAEWCDQWASEGKKNLWGTIPAIVEMQSEGGAVGRGPRHVADRLHQHHVHGVAGTAADDSRTCSRSPANCCRRFFTSPPARWPRTRFPFLAITATSWPAARPAGECSARPPCRRRWISRSFRRPPRCVRGCRSSISSTVSARRTKFPKLKCSTKPSCAR